MGSATGSKHVSAISHSSILPIGNHKSGNRDRRLKENAPSRLSNRILTISDLKQNASGIFQYSLRQSLLWLAALKYSERSLSQSSLWLRFQLPSLNLPCSSEPTSIQTFQLQALVLISCIRMQTFSALSVRSHQRRNFSSLIFAYRHSHDLKLAGAQTFEFRGARGSRSTSLAEHAARESRCARSAMREAPYARAACCSRNMLLAEHDASGVRCSRSTLLVAHAARRIQARRIEPW